MNSKSQLTKSRKRLNFCFKFHNKTPVIYADADFEGVAIRMRQQINENAKQLCWHHVLPEMNHNELVGWAGGKNEYAVVFLRTSFDHPRTQVRMDICNKIIAKYTKKFTKFMLLGNQKFNKHFILSYLEIGFRCFWQI